MRILIAALLALTLSACVAEPAPGYYTGYAAAPGYYGYGPGFYDGPFFGSSFGLFLGGGRRFHRHHHFHHHHFGGFHHGRRGFHHHGRRGGWHGHDAHH